MAAGHRETAHSVLDGSEPGTMFGQDGPSEGGPSMRDTSLLQRALGLTPPWMVSRADFDPKAFWLDIQIEFAPAAALSARSAERRTAQPTTPSGRPGGTSTSSSTKPI
jgi:hypothetical protein